MQHRRSYLPWLKEMMGDPLVMGKRVDCQHNDSGQPLDKARITVAGRQSLHLSPAQGGLLSDADKLSSAREQVIGERGEGEEKEEEGW